MQVLWQTLWLNEKERTVSRLWAVPYCAFFMLFPIGIFTGANGT